MSQFSDKLNAALMKAVRSTEGAMAVANLTKMTETEVRLMAHALLDNLDMSPLQHKLAASILAPPEAQPQPETVFLAADELPRPIAQALELQQQKGRSYNANVSRDAYFPFGLLSYAQMIHVKAMRLNNLAQKSPDDRPIELFESARDTCVDLINYACYAAEHMDAEEGRLAVANGRQA